MTPSRRQSFAELPDMNPGPVCRLATDGVIELANSAAERMFGDLTGRSLLDISPSLTPPVWNRVVSGSETHQYEEVVGEETFVVTLVHRGESDHVYLYGTDITPLKAAERALADHAAELEEMARFPEMNPGPVFRLDLKGTVLLANAAARGLWGGSDLRGKSFFEICPDIGAEVWGRVLAGEEELHHEIQVGDRCLTFTLAHETDSAYAFVYGTDITDLKQVERELARQANEVKEMARFPEMNPGPVCRLDREANIILANRATKEVFDDQDLVGKCWLDLCPGMDGKKWEEVLVASEVTVHEDRVNGRDLVFTHTPGKDGHLVFVYGADITDQKTAERALRQTDKLATLGTLAAGVAHELNNPAAAALRAAKQMTDTFSALQRAQAGLAQLELTPAQAERLMTMDAHAKDQAGCGCNLDALALSDREAELEGWLESHGVDNAWEAAPHLASLEYDTARLDAIAEAFAGDALPAVIEWVSQAYSVYVLLDEIQLGSGRVSEIVMALKAYSFVGQAPIQSIDVNEGLRNTLIILRSKLRSGVSVEQTLADDLPKIQAYGSELNQVWTNLIDNAIQAMGGKGTVKLRTGFDAEWITVEIQDSGPGIPTDIQSQIFDPFFTTKAPGEGTGLGLHTCYNIIVKKHTGSLELESEPGRTSFTVRLPRDGVPVAS